MTADLERSDRLQTGRERGAAAALDRLNAQAVQLDKDAGAASGSDAARLRSLATTIKALTAKLR